MTTKQTIPLTSEQSRAYAVRQIQQAQDGFVCIIQEPKRSNLLNAKLHASLSDIADQVEWHGKKLNIDVWKRLCMAAWLRELNEQPMLIPALDGWGVDIVFEKTSRLTQKQCSSLVDWIICFGDEKGVKWSAPDNWEGRY